MTRGLFLKFGPGVIFAANAVGVSHLVQSTRAGAGYGLSLLLLIFLITALKYPLFRFASTYSAVSGKTLLDAYRKDGHFAVFILILSVVIDMFIATAAVSLVTAGIVKNVFGIDVSTLLVITVLILGAFFLLAAFGYSFFEKLVICMVILFTLMSIAASGMAVPTAIRESTNIMPDLNWSPAFIVFLIAMAGWMPTPPSASFFLSAWSAKRRQKLKDQLTLKMILFDFNFGYALTLIIAFAFVLLGAVLLYLNNINAETDSAVSFAAILMSLFSESYGSWAIPIVGGAAIVVMFSTMLTLFDGAPRVMRQLFGFSETNKKAFLGFLILQAIGVISIVYFFGSSFSTFINFATSTAFATAPFIAIYNYRAIMNDDIPDEAKPRPYLRIWNFISAGVLFVIGIYYFLNLFGVNG
ncbi:divalent metal cation transporter [Emcibacteraceae bacterium]|nr:divalent metal cation transporter [Kordiimonadaceae bacterium]MDA7569363.1 divalent metal cation transporter [Emcibacteraceae bacterium]MDA9554104.1 divalent metal cation transporter [Emcibacteraceae bacterium]MDC1090107.1 divalent metal cation transporter [Emcibacteraceae bacterium]